MSSNWLMMTIDHSDAFVGDFEHIWFLSVFITD